MTTAVRLAIGALLAWCVVTALAAPEIPLAASGLALLICAAALWRPGAALIALAALTPAGLLLAPAPARGAELLAWAFLTGWLLRLWRPLVEAESSRAIVLPALLYAACAVASWVSLMVAGAAGVDTPALGSYLGQAITPQYLVFSNTDTQTWTAVQAVTGIALLLAANAIAAADVSARRHVAPALAISMAVLGAATCVDVIRQWAAYGYDIDFLLRYTRGERFALHLNDLNAAGSQYVLAAGIAFGLAVAGTARWAWWALLAVMLPAFWLTGSRTAVVALAGAVATVLAVRRRSAWGIARVQVLTAAAVLVLALSAVIAIAVFGGNERGSAGRALRLRTQFSETSIRMLASSPLFGVGVGRYFARSPEFMPAEIKSLYGAENAHNYFAQQFAELGVVGGALFAWLVIVGLIAAWKTARAGRDPAAIALLGGCAGYVLTCVTGHPFLLSEAAFSFWIALGVLVAGAPHDEPGRPWRRVLPAAVGILLLANIGLGARSYADARVAPAESGFEASAVAADGRAFRWTSPHVTTYVPDGPGFLRITMRAPDVRLARPMRVETSVAGRIVDSRQPPSDRWVTIEIPVRTPATAPFRRVDIRISPFWTEQRQMARRTALVDVSLGVMVAELRWVTPAGR